MDKLAVYVLNFNDGKNHHSNFVFADLLDYALQEFKKKSTSVLQLKIPEDLMAQHNSINGSKKINPVFEVKEVMDIYQNMSGCSIAFESPKEAIRHIKRFAEYAGEIDCCEE